MAHACLVRICGNPGICGGLVMGCGGHPTNITVSGSLGNEVLHGSSDHIKRMLGARWTFEVMQAVVTGADPMWSRSNYVGR